MSGLAAMRKELADVRGQQAALAQRARKLERMIEEAVSRMRDQEGAGAAAPSNVMSYNYKGRIVYSNAQPPSSAEDSDGMDDEEEGEEEGEEDSGEESDDLESRENVLRTFDLLSKKARAPSDPMRF